MAEQAADPAQRVGLRPRAAGHVHRAARAGEPGQLPGQAAGAAGSCPVPGRHCPSVNPYPSIRQEPSPGALDAASSRICSSLTDSVISSEITSRARNSPSRSRRSGSAGWPGRRGSRTTGAPSRAAGFLVCSAVIAWPVRHWLIGGWPGN